MKIKLAILEKDKSYLNRITTVFNTRYADKLEVYSFTELANLMDTLKHSKIDIVVVSEDYEIDLSLLPPHCGFAYLVEETGIETYKGQRTIGKFQKAELIYKQLLSIFSDSGVSITSKNLSDDSISKVIWFTEASGGNGSSTMAVSFALKMTAMGKKILYLNLEEFGSCSYFFRGDAQFTFSDVIFALKSKNSNLSLKLESTVCRDQSGVYFFATAANSLDIHELTSEDIQKLIQELKICSTYDYIVVDMKLDLSDKSMTMLNVSNNIVFICDGSEIANNKLERAIETMEILEEQEKIDVMDKISVIYNKFSNKTSNVLVNDKLVALGGVPRYEHALTLDVVEQLRVKNIFDRLI